jgi:molecular chaperone DnaK
MSLPYLSETDAGRRIDYKRIFTRDELERWAAPLIDRLEPPCLAAVARCGLKAEDIQAIILVGGMTRMPSVQAKISSIFGRPPLKVVNPDEIVSIGAATQAAILDGTVDGVVLLDVTSRAIGLSTNGQRYQQVIAKSAAVPTREHKIVSTTEDGQRTLSIDVFEGESPHPTDNRHLGRFVLGNIPDGRAGEVMLLIEFTVNVDGILRVSASDMASGSRPEIRLVATAGLTRKDVSRMANSLSEARAAGKL